MFDLIIIGAGIIGASAAYFAAQHMPSWNILLLDRSMIGTGATQYSVGLDFPYGRTPLQKRLSQESNEAYLQLKALMPELPIRSLPFFGVVSREHLSQVLSKFTLEDVHRAGEDEFQRLLRVYPDLRLGGEQVLLTGCRASYGFAAQIAQALVAQFRREAGAQCWEGVEVESLERAGERFALHTMDGRTLHGRRVLLATGPWSLRGPGAEFARAAGVRIKKVAALHIARVPARQQEPMIYFFDEDAFLLPIHERGEWVFSFTSQEWDCAPEISALKINAEERASALSVLARYCPSFVEDCSGGRVFCDAYSQDRGPLVARVPEMNDFIMAGACSGAGYRLAPGMAREALRHLSGFVL